MDLPLLLGAVGTLISLARAFPQFFRLLRTRDAHGVYAALGFGPYPEPESFMQLMPKRPDGSPLPVLPPPDAPPDQRSVQDVFVIGVDGTIVASFATAEITTERYRFSPSLLTNTIMP